MKFRRALLLVDALADLDATVALLRRAAPELAYLLVVQTSSGPSWWWSTRSAAPCSGGTPPLQGTHCFAARSLMPGPGG